MRAHINSILTSSLGACSGVPVSVEFKCLAFNARSISANLCDFHCLLDCDNYDIIFVTETWLSAAISNGLIDPSLRYNILRRDRSGSAGGGVCIAVTKRISYTEVTTVADVELLAIDVIVRRCKYRFIVVYRPPCRDALGKLYAYKLTEQLTALSKVSWPIFIVGDFNCPRISWGSFTAPSDGIEDLILDFTLQNGFSQLVNEPTRLENILDLILCNEPLLVTGLSVESPIGNSDHASVEFCVSNSSCSDYFASTHYIQDTVNRVYKWKDADYDSMRSYLSGVDWQSLFSFNLTVDSLWSAFCDILQSAIDLYVPFYTVSSSKFSVNRTKLRKYPRVIRKAIARKRCLWRCHRHDLADENLWRQYKAAHSECRKLIREYELKRETEVVEANNLGKFYRFVNNKMACKTGVATLRDADQNAVIDDQDKANLLNRFFASVCTVDDGNCLDVVREVPDDVCLNSIDFSPEYILRAMRKMKNKTSSGPDGFSPTLVKNIGSCLVYPLNFIYTSFMSVGKVPMAWKVSIVTPIYKSGLASDPGNYRPIALTSIFSKLMERIISAQILEYCRKHCLISEQQHGFLSKRSTTTNLLDCLNDWTCALMNRHSVAVAYIDFQKAFDSVCHAKLFLRLESLGISDNLLDWFKSFLSNRQQSTRVGDAISDILPLTSGVIQGSCLGPVLFVLYVNSILQVLSHNVKCSLFADDVKLYTALKFEHDIENLQTSIDQIVSWSSKWQLPISVRKCSLLICGNSVRYNEDAFCSINGTIINQVDEVKDLGVIVDSSLKFNSHINCMVAKAHARAHLIRKCFVSRNSNILMKAFNAYVRPLLEYASPVWSPHYRYQIDKIEAVQRRFTKRLHGLNDLDYTTRLNLLGLSSLEKRRIIHDLVLAYKIIFGLIDVQSSKYFSLRTTVSTVTRGNQYKVVVNNCRVNTRKYYFSERIGPVWNSLPPSVVNFSNLSTFKRTVNNVKLELFTRY